MNKKIKRIAIITSGGDAPGMNAAIRAIVRTAVNNDVEVFGFKRGYEGLLSADFTKLKTHDVTNILFKGGTKLLTARCDEMKTPEGQEKAAQICKVLNIDALIVIGGDGSLKGGHILSKLGVNVIGIPGTIDLDLPASDYTIGFDTAVSTAVEAIGKIRDTSISHERCSVVEVMGRNAGYIALYCGLTGGAEEVLIPEKPEVDLNAVTKVIIQNRAKGMMHNLVIVAEGIGGSQEIAKHIEKITGIETRATILGHLQRGGSPSVSDRVHASIMGYNAVKMILEGKKNRLIIIKNGDYADVDLEEGLKVTKKYNDDLYKIIKILAI